MSSSNATIIAALRILACEIQSGDGVANSVISEAADRIGKLEIEISTVGRIASDEATFNDAILARIRSLKNQLRSAWTKTAEQGPDDECAVLMALSENEVWSGFRLDGQWHFINGDPCCEVPTHWMHLPRHPLDIAP
ncbi:hypothetical protein HQN60_12490 [Deefgea piscis]|uniref:DUF551 domain-containing protein n=1 Tax=Deefgea piscis TaxID=2739061 RepID=A0A6M8SV62_9NEIS|nr:hypothetical protein [Deefgea piscis]QKJ67456.1 hypothetical protein HQN60_12490 [Deefgea piscis]